MIGSTLGPYRIEAELGAGGMGTVYRARADDGALVALKVVHPHLLASKGFRERFEREARLGLAITHANVVRTIACLEVEKDALRVPALVLEHVEGRPLSELVRDLGRVPEDLCRHLAQEIASGLAAIHAAGIVHRDLKPDNVLVTPQHGVKVMDLGLARQASGEDRLSATGVFVGTVSYAPPEQILGAAELDARCDLWSLGAMLYEMVTGARPFAGDSVGEIVRRVLNETPERPGRRAPQTSPFLEELILFLLRKSPQERPASAARVVEILRLAENGSWWSDRTIEIRATRRAPRRVRVPRESELWGREADLADLRRRWEKAKSGEGQALVLEGEAGIGKSRLLDEFLAGLDPDEVHVLVGAWPPDGLASSSSAFVAAYGGHFGKDEKALARALPDCPALVPAFAALLRGDAAPPGAEPLTKQSLATCFVHATRSLAEERPLLVVVDDLHFAADEGRAVFASLTFAVEGRRALLVGTARPGLATAWYAEMERREHAARRPLSRLDGPALESRLSRLLGGTPAAGRLAIRVASKADGNPFVVFEMLRSLREAGVLAKGDDGTWSVAREATDVAIPSSVRDLVGARLVGLDADDREILEAAACQGAEFDGRLVAEALGRPRLDVLRRLGRLERDSALVRAAGPRFAFDHHLVHELLRDSVAPALLEEYHAATADAIELRENAATKAPKDLPGQTCVELAEHFLAGGRGPRAMRYLDSALTHLATSYRNEAAVELADRALAAPGLVVGKERFEVLLRKAERLEVLGRRDAERAALDEALAVADAEGDPSRRARARSALGWHFACVSRPAEAQFVLGEALGLARIAGDRATEAAATGYLGRVFRDLGRLSEAQAQHERHLALTRETGDRQGEAAATGNLGTVFQSLGRFTEARTQYERQLALAREIGDRRGEAAATGNLGVVLLKIGRFAEAQAQHERSLALVREIGDRRGEVAATGNQAGVLYLLGRFAEAQEQFERHVVLAREIGDRLREAVGLVNLGPLRIRLGDPVGARRDLMSSLTICREIGARYPEGYALLGLASAADEDADHAEAMRLAEESLALRRRIGHGDGVAESLAQVAELRHRAGDADGARAALEEALRLSRERSSKTDIVSCLVLLALLPGGDAQAALAAVGDAGAELDKRDAVRLRFLLWQATKDRAHLAEAKRLLDFMVEHAPPDRREPMLANVRLHREILAAAREEGL